MPSEPVVAKPRTWDQVGIVLSGLCAAHCLLVPFVLVALPLWPRLVEAHAWLHPAFAVLLIPVTLLAIWAHRERYAVLLLSIGLVMVVAATFAHSALGVIAEAGITLAGSALLIAGHVRNVRRSDVRHAH